MSYGWLPRDCSLPPNVSGVNFDPSLPTRREEYHLLQRVALETFGDPGLALDVGCGSIPGWHVAPYILSKLGWRVVALDPEPSHLNMPADESVVRVVGKMEKIEVSILPDFIYCISVLEHLNIRTRAAFGAEVSRLKPSVLLVTADNYKPESLVSLFPDYDFGRRTPDPDEHLHPRVAYAYGKPVQHLVQV